MTPVVATPTAAEPIVRPERSRFRSRPSTQYWDVWQARWTSADAPASGPIPPPRRGDQAGG
jgi:hypothetical protein